MKLSFDKIKELIIGAARIEEENGCLKPYRFTKEQQQLYKEKREKHYTKTLSSSGIKLLFKTDSEKMFLKINTQQATSRKYFSVDVFVDGVYADSLDNFSHIDMPQDYTTVEVPLGSHSKEFNLGGGEKTVCVHLPWSVGVEIEELSIDDTAFVEGMKLPKKLLVFGDSISQGYDAQRPSNRYVAKLAQLLDAEEMNKAIGGEVFFPELSELKDDIEPDYIIVAYGTNDWVLTDSDTFKVNCKSFYTNIRNNYPNAKMFAITPIWRDGYTRERPFGEFLSIDKYIRECVNDLDGVTVISGFEFVPHSSEFFADLILHPNDKGFDCYFENLSAQIKGAL